MDIEREILRFPLRALKRCGKDPEQSKIKYLTFSTIFAFFCLIQIFMMILQILDANGDINVIAPNLEGVAAWIQIGGRFLISAIKIEGYRKIIDDTKIFWSTKICTESVRENIENNLKRILQLQKLSVFMMTSSGLIVLVASCVIRQLPTGFWIMKDHNLLFTITLVTQQVIVGWGAISVSAYDCLFLGLCVSLRTQFKMLQCCLRDLDASIIFSKSDEKVYLNKLISYVRHHEYLLRFSKDLQRMYSPIMLIIYSGFLFVYCAEMYMVFESNGIFPIVRNSFVMASGLIVLAFYCIPINYITDEAISVSQGIYESNWYSKNLSTSRGFITLIIQRSQQDIIFNAGGLIVMNCGALLRIIRMSYSVCTIMRALKNV